MYVPTATLEQLIDVAINDCGFDADEVRALDIEALRDKITEWVMEGDECAGCY